MNGKGRAPAGTDGQRRESGKPLGGSVAPPSYRHRLPGLDCARGVAFVLMACYHFCFDLHQMGWLEADFNHDPVWLLSRTVIVSLFLLLVGLSATLAGGGAIRRARRLLRIAGCAALVTGGSWLMFPRSYIWFGILHFIAVAGVLMEILRPLGRINLALGCGVLAAGISLSLPVFDQAALNWVGFMTHKPLTEDYVPLFPWFGVVLIGAGGAGTVLHLPVLRAGVLEHAPWRWLGLAGRHSLLLYMVHQPVLLGLLYAVQWATAGR